MNDRNSMEEFQSQEDSSPDGVEAELELTARFQNMMQSIALTRARYRGSEKKLMPIIRCPPWLKKVWGRQLREYINYPLSTESLWNYFRN